MEEKGRLDGGLRKAPIPPLRVVFVESNMPDIDSLESNFTQDAAEVYAPRRRTRGTGVDLAVCDFQILKFEHSEILDAIVEKVFLFFESPDGDSRQWQEQQ